MTETPTITSTSKSMSEYFESKTYDKVPIESFNDYIYQTLTPTLPSIDTLRDKIATLPKPLKFTYPDTSIQITVDEHKNLLIIFDNGEAFVFSSPTPEHTFHLFSHSSDASTPGHITLMTSINSDPVCNLFNPFLFSKLVLMLEVLSDIETNFPSL